MNKAEREVVDMVLALRGIIFDVHELYSAEYGAAKFNKLNDIYQKHGYHPIAGWLAHNGK